MTYPDYGMLGTPNLDPYFMSPADEAKAVADLELKEAFESGNASYNALEPESCCPYGDDKPHLRDAWLDGYGVPHSKPQ